MKTEMKLIATITLAAASLSSHAQQPAPGAAGVPSVSPQSPPAAMAGGPPPGPRREDHVARAPSLEASLAMAKAVVESCHGYHVSVSILDAEGSPKLFYVPDGTAGFHAYMGFRKANTALKFAMPSGKVADATKTDPQLAAKYQADAANFVSFAGGMPIMLGSEVIGAVGVSGAEPSSKDEACAVDGIKAAEKLLK
jgi:uncharacterized protein GlcG (DUF336 family)